MLRGKAEVRSAIPAAAVAGAAVTWLAVNAVQSPGTFLTMTYIGLTLGSLYGLVAIGYSISYSILELINLPHGFVFMIGVLTTVRFLNERLHVDADMGAGEIVFAAVIVAVVSALVCGALSAGIELVAYRPLRRAPRLAPLVTAVGVLFILNNVLVAWNAQHGATSIPDLLPRQTLFVIAGAPLGVDRVLIVALAVLAFAALSAFVQWTWFGRAMRAVAQDQEAAALVGVNVNRTITGAFLVAGALAGLAAVPYTLYVTTVSWDAALQLGLIGFAAAVVGGIGSPAGAALGGVLIGLVAAYSDGLPWLAPGTDWTESVVLCVLILVLVIRPTGLLGERVAGDAVRP
jgi:branched-chain amino acid transport system permease protein